MLRTTVRSTNLQNLNFARAGIYLNLLGKPIQWNETQKLFCVFSEKTEYHGVHNQRSYEVYYAARILLEKSNI
jgi:hypothetical protein